jgi:hypothetical protein
MLLAPALTPARVFLLTLTVTALAALSACGGGSDDNTAATGPAPLTGPAGQLVAMGPDLLASGTYTVVGCINGSGQAVSRKVRLNDDGSLQWLDAANNDAVLASYTPGSTVRDQRFFALNAGGNYWLSAAIYTDGTLTGPRPSSAVRAQAAVGSIPLPTVNFNIRNDRVTVNTNTGLSDYCSADNLSNPATTNVVSIPVVLNDAIVARRLASAIALNNNNQALSTSETVNYTDSNDSAASMVVGRTVATNGQVSSTVNGTTTAWGDWIAAVKAAPARGMGSYTESWYASNASGSASPGNPQVGAELVHPTLTYASGWEMYAMLENNTTGATPLVSLVLLNDSR